MMKKKVRTIYDWRKDIMNKNLARIITSFSCACILLSGNVYAEETKIDKPVIEYNEAKQKNIAVYDSIYMGSYPQSEVVSKDAVMSSLLHHSNGMMMCLKFQELNTAGRSRTKTIIGNFYIVIHIQIHLIWIHLTGEKLTGII